MRVIFQIINSKNNFDFQKYCWIGSIILTGLELALIASMYVWKKSVLDIVLELNPEFIFML